MRAATGVVRAGAVVHGLGCAGISPVVQSVGC